MKNQHLRRRFRDFLLQTHDWSMARSFEKSMQKAARRSGANNMEPGMDAIRKFKDLWQPFGFITDPLWISYYASMNGCIDPRYIPIPIYYLALEPVLNNKRFVAAYKDKNAYDLLFPDIHMPAVYLRCIDGLFYDHGYNRMDERGFRKLISRLSLRDLPVSVLMKPSIDSGRGKSVRKLICNEGNLFDETGQPLSLIDLAVIGGRNFLIQQYVIQHECTARLNTSSLNALRVFTYRSVSDGRIIPLHIMHDVGTPGSIIDLFYRIGLSPDGRYNHFCTDGNGERQTNINGLKLDTLHPFPFMEQVKECAISIAERIMHSNVLGFDLAVDKDGQVVMIEVNNIFIGVNNLQLHGGPLFHEYTDEVIAYCLSNKKTYSFYFER